MIPVSTRRSLAAAIAAALLLPGSALAASLPAGSDAAALAATPGSHGLPDYSGVGYRNGEADLPSPPVVETLAPGEGDDTDRLQAAIDALQQRKPGEGGSRGTLLLGPGTFEVSRTLLINQSGVVLRAPATARRRTAERSCAGPPPMTASCSSSAAAATRAGGRRPAPAATSPTPP